MGIPSRAHFQKQGPATNCVVNGKALGWLSCTCYATAMGIDKSTLSKQRPSGCAVRTATGDTSGGTTLEQMWTYCTNHEVKTEIHVGGQVSSAYYLAVQLQLGRGAVVQGDAAAMVGTAYRSTGGAVSHAVWVNDVRGGTLGSPSQAFVYDPAADGRTASWGKAARGPQWWPWSLVLKFASMLRPNGPGTPMIGANKIYCLIFPDTEPHAHLWAGARRTSPFPDNQIVKSPVSGQQVNVRKGPSKAYPVVRTLANGHGWLGEVGPLVAWQYKPDGGLDSGTRGWYGNHDGLLWLHESGVVNEGGAS